MPSDMWNRAMHDAETGRLQEAIANVRMRQRMKPKDPETTELLGLLLQRAGDTEQSLHYLRRGVELLPGEPIHHHNLASALLSAGRVQEAIRIWQTTLAMAPNLGLAWMGLVNGYLAAEDSTKAIEAGERGLALEPEWADLVGNYAVALERAGRTDDAIRTLERHLQRHPGDTGLRSNLLLLMTYANPDTAAVAAAHRAFGATLPLSSSTREPARLAAPNAAQPLRIGILSSDLRSHSVGYFVEAFMRHAPQGVELVAFSTAVPAADDRMMQRLRSLAGRWHDVAALNDDALDALIRSERIDVLLELNGHTAGGRLEVLARKPAPVIVSAIGYLNTTGLATVDWRLVDAITDPPGSEHLCTERLLRLDPCHLCYTPPTDAPEPASPAADAPLTFGSFNSMVKLGDDSVARWARVLTAIPDARMLIKAQGLGDAGAGATLAKRFERAGVDPARLEMIAYSKTRDEHLRLYNRVHVALDTTPCNGVTTTCEALWMGVPVVAALGDRHTDRLAASLLRAAGHPELVALDADGFVRIAVDLARDRARLTTLRHTLRSDLAASSLLDAPGYAARFHAALRDCWNQSRGAMNA